LRVLRSDEVRHAVANLCGEIGLRLWVSGRLAPKPEALMLRTMRPPGRPAAPVPIAGDRAGDIAQNRFPDGCTAILRSRLRRLQEAVGCKPDSPNRGRAG
jgi:hypothetical protein